MTNGMTAPPNQIRTVLGDIPADQLGRCDYHDHLFQVTPLLPGDELDDEAASGIEAGAMRAAGIEAMVEATPTGLGRDPAGVARISQLTGLHVVHATGAHHAGHYAPDHWLLAASVERLAEHFTADVLEGLAACDQPQRGPLALTPSGAPVRAGLIKAAARYWKIGPFEQRVLAAAGSAAQASGAPVMVHLDYGSAAWEVLEHLGRAGVAPERVVLAHIDRNLDPGLHAELTAAGAYIGYDGMARHREAPDQAIIDCLVRMLADGGDGERVLIGADVARSSRYLAYGGIPGLTYLPERFLPRLRRSLGEDLVSQCLVANPARWLTMAPA